MPNENDSNNPAADPQDQPLPQSPVAPAAPRQGEVGVNPNRRSTDKQEGTVQKLEEDIRTGERWLVRIGAAGVIMNVIIALIYYGQLKEMRKATSASERAAIAAGSAANIADQTLKDQQQSFRDDQRPWIAIWQAHMAINSQIPLGEQIEIVNVGKTPALHITEAATRFIWHPPLLSGPTPKLIGELRFYNAAPIPPQGKTAVSLGDADQREPLVGDWPAIKNGSQILYGFGEIRYEDTFGRKHSTKFCFYLTNPGTTNVLASCTGYNDMN
jgi:hypothetical protein